MARRSEGEIESIDARLEELGRKLDRLRSLYESFFMGIERAPPNAARRELNRLFLEMQQNPIGNASMRFRFQTLLQRWVLMTTYWNRTLREIESGTYRRDLAKAHRHMAARGGVLTEEEALRLGIPSNRVKAFVSQQEKMADRRAKSQGQGQEDPPSDGATRVDRSPVLPSNARPTSDTPSPGPALRPGQVEAFYEKYVAAHRAATGAPPKASLEQVRAKLQKDLGSVLAAKNVKGVELDVVVDGERVRLKARPVR